MVVFPLAPATDIVNVSTLGMSAVRMSTPKTSMTAIGLVVMTKVPFLLSIMTDLSENLVSVLLKLSLSPLCKKLLAGKFPMQPLGPLPNSICTTSVGFAIIGLPPGWRSMGSPFLRFVPAL